MQEKKEMLEFESVILRREMAVPKWYEGFYTQSNASKMKLRLEEKTLHRNTIAELMNHFGYEMQVDPVEGMYRKKQIRTWKVYEDGIFAETVKAKTIAEAIEIVSINKYGTQTVKDHKGRIKTLAELSACDMTAEEVE